MENKKCYHDYIWMVKDGKVIPVEPEQVYNRRWVKRHGRYLRNLPGSGFAYLDVSMEEAGELLKSIEENFPKLSPELTLNFAINYKVDVRIQAALLTELFSKRWGTNLDTSVHYQERNCFYKSIEAEARMYELMLQICLDGQFDRLMIDSRFTLYQKSDHKDRVVWKSVRLRC